MALLSVVRDVCAGVGVVIPTSVFSNITVNRAMQEMVSLANEIAQRIAYDTREWNKLKKTVTFAGDGAAVDFTLPADFKRMLLTANVWRSSSTLYPMRFIPDIDEWLQRRARNYNDPRGEWINYGGQMHIWPVMGTGITATFAYLNKNCVASAGGGFGNEFLADGDSFAIDDRLLKLGMIWQWKAQKGSPYAEDMGTYGDALTIAMGSDGPSPIIIDNLPMSASIKEAYPFSVPSP